MENDLEIENILADVEEDDHLNHERVSLNYNWMTGDADLDEEFIPDRIKQLIF
jgi:hypothetical protein